MDTYPSLWFNLGTAHSYLVTATPMARFDIFRVQPDRSLRWLEAAASLESAEARVKGLPPGEYVVIAEEHAAKRISVKSPAKQIVFQITYADERGSAARESLFRSFGHEVISVADNDAAMLALASFPNVDVFILGHTAPDQVRKAMLGWLKLNFPKVKIVALIPSASPQLLGSDYNIPQRDWPAWFSLFATG